MNKLRNMLQNFMYGRNGADELSRTITIASLIVYVISMFLQNGLLYYLALIGIIYSMFRMFSKNVSARQQENQKLVDFIKLNKLRYEQRKEFRIFKCKGCGRNVRVPKGKGKIEITCPVCGRKEVHRT